MVTPSHHDADSFRQPLLASRLWLPPMEGIDKIGRAGLIALPGSGRVVWWTGKVAIGLRYQPPGSAGSDGDATPWIAA